MVKNLVEDKSGLKEYVVSLKDDFDEMVENYQYSDLKGLILNLESILHNAKTLKEEVEGITDWQERK